MTRTANKLTAMAVQRATKRGLYGDGNGLSLQIGRHGTKSWVLRYMLNGKPRYMGLGPIHSVTLAEARERAREARSQIARGHDPLSGKATHARSLSRTFDACTEAYLKAMGPGMSERTLKTWTSSLAKHASPVIGNVPVGLLDATKIVETLTPIWATKTETASRVRQRIESILDWAAVQGMRSGENPARWDNHLVHVLPAKGKVSKARSHPALPYDLLPALMQRLEANDYVSARALEFTILCASRTGEVLGARWEEIDFAARIWTVPASRMKARKEHRVPLSDSAVALLQALPRKGEHVFINGGGKPLSNAAMSELLKGMSLPSTTPGKLATVHGMRSTFRDWAGDQTNHQSEVIETALAHQIDSKVEAAYRRSDALDKRTRLMADWAAFASGSTGAEVVRLHA
jgi:integrase